MPRTLSTPPPTSLVKTEAQGRRLVSPLEAEVNALTITTPEEYASADELLGGIRNARREWKELIEPVLKPAREVKQNADALNRKIDGPLAELEVKVKNLMSEFKLIERRQLEAANRKVAEEQARLNAKIQETADREAAARTAQMRERLARQRESLEAQAAEVEVVEEVKATHSTVRVTKRWRIANADALLKGLLNGSIPRETFAFAPTGYSIETIAEWPGIEIVEEATIVGRGGR